MSTPLPTATSTSAASSGPLAVPAPAVLPTSPFPFSSSTSATSTSASASTSIPIPDNKADVEADQIVIDKVQQALQTCIARKKYYEQAIEYYKKAPFSEVIHYFKKHYLVYKIQHSEKEYRDALHHLFTKRLSTYDFIIKFLEKFSIDESYLYARIEAFLQYYNVREKKDRKKEKAKLKPTEKWGKSERFFFTSIMELLKPYISKELDILLKKGWISFEPNLGVGKDFLLLGKEEIIAPYVNLTQTFDNSVNQQTGFFLLGNIRGEYFIKTQIPLLEALRKQAEDKNTELCAKMGPYANYDARILVQQVMEFRALYIQIRKIMKPIRDRKKSMLIELEYAKEYDRILNQVEAMRKLVAVIDNKKISIQNEDSAAPMDPANKKTILLNQIDQKIIQAKMRWIKIVSDFEQLEIVVGDLFFGNTLTDESFMDSVRYHLYEFNQLKEALKIETQIYSELTRARTLAEKEVESTAATVTVTDTPSSAKALSKSEPKPEPNKEYEPKTSTKPKDKTLSRAEWLLKVEEGRKQRLLEKKRKLQALVGPAIDEIRASNLLKKMRVLSEGDLKKRSERIQTMGLSQNIKTSFENLYTYKFCHNDLVSLIKALKEKGENIELQYPSGGSSHYTIKIGLVLGYYEELDEEESNSNNSPPVSATSSSATSTVVESGKAFTPHKNKAQKNSKCFAKFIVENIQSVFWRAGYTPEALGLTLSQEFDFSKFRL